MPKKDFKIASELFLTQPKPEPAPTITSAAAPPDGYKLVRESKTERLQILIRPTVHEKLKRIAAAQGLSKNEIINNLIEDYIKGDE